jgi:hypothetical protein
VQLFDLVALAHGTRADMFLNRRLCAWHVEVAAQLVQCLLYTFVAHVMDRGQDRREVRRVGWHIDLVGLGDEAIDHLPLVTMPTGSNLFS